MAKESLNLKKAVAAWQRCVGAKNVSTSPKDLEAAELATFTTSQSIAAIISPNSAKEVQECVKIANHFKIPLYPISKGKNWGYGSRVPPVSGCVVVSLERMNRILEFNKDFAYITVEPGVTFQQAYNFLEKNNTELIAPSIGSVPEASLIGNALERGIGKSHYGDRFQHSCNMEVVLPSGDCIQTGFGHLKKARSKNTYRWGVGPSLDGIFTQSNFGIVTRMTFWLLPKPKYFQTFFYRLTQPEQLPKLVDALRMLRLEGTLTTSATIANDYRILSMKQQFPFDQYSPKYALPLEYLNAVRKKQIGGALWVGDDAILAATEAIGKARAARVKSVLKPIVDNIVFFDNKRAALYSFLSKPIKLITGIGVQELLYFHYHSFYLGNPLTKQLLICYFRKKFLPKPQAIDPDKDRCGIMWISPSVPFSGRDVSIAIKTLTSSYKKFNFEPNIGLNFMSERNIAVTAAIIYDQENKVESERAASCYKHMMHRITEEGFFPYRLGINSMQRGAITDSESYKRCLITLKKALDPNNILAPSRYGISIHYDKSYVQE